MAIECDWIPTGNWRGVVRGTAPPGERALALRSAVCSARLPAVDLAPRLALPSARARASAPCLSGAVTTCDCRRARSSRFSRAVLGRFKPAAYGKKTDRAQGD